MNREKEDQLPLMQIGFIDSICLPIYEVRRNDYNHASMLFNLNVFIVGIRSPL